MMGRANRRPVQPATSAIEPRPQPLPMLTVLTVLTQNPQFILGNLRVGNLLARLRAGADSPELAKNWWRIHIAGDMRLVLDTNVLIAAFRSRAGAAAEVVRLVRRRELTMVATVALFVEYEAVLTRPQHLATAKMTVAEAEIALDVLAAVAEPVESYFLWRPRLRDADDDMVLEAAVSGRADAIATFNTRDFTGVQSEFGIAVLTPAGILKEIVK
jgi:putative PIN family toxin of toxin-antitoxin system